MKYPEMSDEKLLQFYLSNSPAALATLTDLYKDRVYSTIFGMVQDKHVAEDIFRDTFITIINQLMAGKMPEHGNFLEWAKQLAQQLCVEHSRKSRMSIVIDNQDKSIDTPQFVIAAVNPETTYYECHSKLRSMINMLPEQQREVIALNHYAGLSFRDIADRMKCTLTTALDHMKNGLSNLRTMMTEREIVLG